MNHKRATATNGINRIRETVSPATWSNSIRAKITLFEYLRLTRWRRSRQSDYCIQITSTLTLKPLRVTGFTGGVTRPFNVTLV